MIWSSNCYNVTWFVNLNVVLLCSVCYKRVTLERLLTSLNLHVYTHPAVNTTTLHYAMGHVVAQLVEALRYKPEGRGFESPMVSLEFFY